jgi:hypothetical protein
MNSPAYFGGYANGAGTACPRFHLLTNPPQVGGYFTIEPGRCPAFP